MAWTAPKDWTTGEGLTDAKLRTYLTDNLAYLQDTYNVIADGAIPWLGNDVSLWQAVGNGATVTQNRCAVTANGTATTRNVAATNAFETARRLGYVTGAVAGTAAGIRNGFQQYNRTNRVEFICEWGVSLNPANAWRGGVGFVAATTAHTNDAWTSLTAFPNVAMFGWDTTDTVLSFFHNDGSGAPTKVPLSTSLSALSPVSTNWYLCRIVLNATNNRIDWYITNGSAEDSGSATTDIPTVTTLLCWRANCINTAAVSYGIDIGTVTVVRYEV